MVDERGNWVRAEDEWNMVMRETEYSPFITH
jgi:hypothetical protein